MLWYIKPGALVRKPGGLGINRVVWCIKPGGLVIFKTGWFGNRVVWFFGPGGLGISRKIEKIFSGENEFLGILNFPRVSP